MRANPHNFSEGRTQQALPSCWWKLSRCDNSARVAAGGTKSANRVRATNGCAALRGAGFRSAKTATIRLSTVFALLLLLGIFFPIQKVRADEGLNLVAAEYFWDTDPGVSNGVPVTVPAAETFSVGYPNAIPLNVDLSSLSSGLHRLGFRVLDATNRASDIAWLPVQVIDPTNLLAGITATPPISDANNLLMAAEYFFDTDPGAGNGTNLTIPPGETFAIGLPTTNLLNVDISSLTGGLHKLGFRTRDASSRWSAVEWLPLQVQDAATLLAGVTATPPVSDASKLLVAAEYFWDTDPGTNNGTPISFPAGETYAPGSSAIPALTIPVPHLPLGVHYLGLRVKDASGIWAAAERTAMILDRKTDFNLATAITVLTNTNTNSFAISAIACPGPGQTCANTFDLSVTTASLLTVQYTAHTSACADVRIHFWVDGTERAASSRLAAGAASGWFALGPVSSGSHLLQMQAEGFLGGCDVGTLTSWAGSLQVVTSSLTTNIAGGDFTHTAGLANGLAVADFNGDGYADIFQTMQDQSGVLFLNNKNGAMNRTNLLPSLSATNGQTAAWADYDNDGWLDLLVTTSDRTLADRNLLYHNLGGTNFTLLAVTNMPSAESNSVGCAWADVDNDGFVDFVIATTNGTRIELYRNNGDGTFASLSTSSNLLSGGACAVAFGDFDNDGRPDLVSVGIGGVHLFRNFGTNQFLEVIGNGVANDVTAQSVSWADYDNDGWLDLFIASSDHLGELFHNNHDFTFTQVQASIFNVPGFVAVSCAWGDFDQDGRMDLFVSSGTTNNLSRLFHNNPGGTFTIMTNGPGASPTGVYAGSAWADMDRNGTPDLLVANHGGTNLLFQNLGSGAGWLRVKLSGRPSNKSAIGAKVRVLANIDGESFWQLQEVSGGNGYASQGELPLTFGLGDATNVSSVRIEWSSGLATIYTNLPLNQLLTVPELPEGQPVITVNQTFQASGQYSFVSLDPVTVTIDSPFQNGFVFYTTDGSPPDFTANWYTGPFEISPPAQIRAVAYDETLSEQVFGDPAQLILVPTFFLTNSTPGGGDFTLSPPGPNYLSNTVVTAVATNAPGWTFMNWAGSISGTNATNTFVMNSDKDVIAVFGSPLSVTALGGATFGIVSNSPASMLYPFASTPRLTAVPATGKYFVRWGLSGSTATNLTSNPMDWAMTNASPFFIALLANLPTNTYSLTVLKNGQGSVTRNPNASFYTNGTAVTLTAAPVNGEFFLGWSGDVTGAQNPITVTMNSSKVITASFGLQPPLFSFAASSYQVDEAAGSVTLNVRNNGVPGTVDFSTTNGTAVGSNGSSGDFISTNGTLTFAYGETNKTIAIGIHDNFLVAADKTFQVQLSNATGGSGSLTNPSVAAVAIHYNDVVATNGSLLAQSFPDPVPDRSGSLRVTIAPPQPQSAGGFWRFPWELAWRSSSALVTNLSQANYDVEFREIAGYAILPVPPQLVLANGLTTDVTNQYASVGADVTGQLTVNLGPNNPVVIANAGWRLLGETNWLNPGATMGNLSPADNYLVEFKPITGLAAPSIREVSVFASQQSIISAYYELPSSLPTNAALPNPLPSLGYITGSVTNNPRQPYAFNGQLQSDVGFGSGVAVRTHTVLTAAHIVFNDATLAYVDKVYWFFQKQTGELDPKPQTARGWYVLSGYASARTNDLTVLTNQYSPGVSSSESRSADVAVLYFQSPSARNSYGGYLSSDAATNEWLASSQPKMLVGYPLDGTPFGYTNIVSGKMHATATNNYAFTLQTNRVYTAPGFLSFPGNSGGPVYVLCTNGIYYPAAVYLGTVGSSSAVRAIDGDVVNLINLAELSAVFGDSGTNFTGGGVARWVSSGAAAFNPGTFKINLFPTNIVSLGGAWRVQGGADTNWINDSGLYFPTNTGALVVEFRLVPNHSTPTPRTINLVANQTTAINAFYDLISVTQPQLLANGSLQMTLGGSTGRVYWLQTSTNLLNWTNARQLTNTSGVLVFTNAPLPNSPVGFFRIKE